MSYNGYCYLLLVEGLNRTYLHCAVFFRIIVHLRVLNYIRLIEIDAKKASDNSP